MSRCLGTLLGVVAFAYIDDIIVFSNSIEDHMRDLEKVLMKISEANLKIKLSKCEFFKTEVRYLGFIISKNGLSYPKNKKVAEAPIPKSTKELQRFLGTCNFVRKFIPAFSEIAKPLYHLLRKDVKYDFNADCIKSYNKLKELINSTPVLAHPDFTKCFYLFTDASNTGIGAVLMQTASNGKDLRPIEYFSKTLSKVQMKYSTTKKECSALVTAIKKFQYTISGYPLTVLTDHRPLTYMFSKKLPTDAALARWCLSLQGFSLELKYYPGKNNVVADYLSRLEEPPNELDIKNCETLINHD